MVQQRCQICLFNISADDMHCFPTACLQMGKMLSPDVIISWAARLASNDQTMLLSRLEIVWPPLPGILKYSCDPPP